MGRDDRRRARTPQEQAQSDMTASGELLDSGALSAGERAAVLASLAQANLLAVISGQLAEIAGILRDGVLRVDAAKPGDIRDLKNAMDRLAVSGYDNRGGR